MRRATKLTTFFTITGITALTLSGCSAGGSTQAAPETTETVAVGGAAIQDAPAAATFTDGVLAAEDVTITITDSRTIQVGEAGNEYGSGPVIAFWYDITNKQSERDVTPTDWVFYFKAFQDNDPNVENELMVALLPDQQFQDTQLENIKVGGTTASAVAYELTDTTTPVDLIASTDFGRTEIGTATFTLQ